MGLTLPPLAQRCRCGMRPPGCALIVLERLTLCHGQTGAGQLAVVQPCCETDTGMPEAEAGGPSGLAMGCRQGELCWSGSLWPLPLP